MDLVAQYRLYQGGPGPDAPVLIGHAGRKDGARICHSSVIAARVPDTWRRGWQLAHPAIHGRRIGPSAITISYGLGGFELPLWPAAINASEHRATSAFGRAGRLPILCSIIVASQLPRGAHPNCHGAGSESMHRRVAPHLRDAKAGVWRLVFVA